MQGLFAFMLDQRDMSGRALTSNVIAPAEVHSSIATVPMQSSVMLKRQVPRVVLEGFARKTHQPEARKTTFPQLLSPALRGTVLVRYFDTAHLKVSQRPFQAKDTITRCSTLISSTFMRIERWLLMHKRYGVSFTLDPSRASD